MKNLFFIFTILMFLFKTENVLSNNSIFNVDNIEIDKSSYANKNTLLNKAFKKGFIKLIDRILLKKDAVAISLTQISEIKTLVSYYQIKERNQNKKNTTIVNIFFDREKINSFFYNKNISYADISNSKLVLLPILVENENFYLFSDNYFYKNWNNLKLQESKYIEYILPIENLESIELIKKNINNLENISASKILFDYDIKNNIFLVINKKKKINIFIKGNITDKEVVKNFYITTESSDNKKKNDEIITKIKKEIIEIIKSQNLIDVRTPSFLNVNLLIKKQDDLLKAQNIFNKIDLIEKFNVQELNKDKAKIKIKFYGKLEKISEKLLIEGIELLNTKNEWNIKII